MKRFFMTFAAMLLMSVSAFAQSSETPLKGDVNEDGVVDVADITALIAIIKNYNGAEGETTYYWYAGTTEPTADNISSIKTGFATTKPSWTSTNRHLISATNNTDSAAYIYYCFPSSWNIIFYDGNSEISLVDVSTFIYDNIAYTVKMTGRKRSAGTTLNLYVQMGY